jgi:hypothetical protein
LGSVSDAWTWSVCGSKRRAVGALPMDGQTLRMRPRSSKVSEPHSDAGYVPSEVVNDPGRGPAIR